MIKEELERSIREYSSKYYSGEATIDDSEFDSLVEALRQIDPNNSLLEETGFGFNVAHGKTKHPYVELKSLSKVRVPGTERIKGYNLITPKFDGANVEIIYKDGAFCKAISRGNGVYGIDISEKLAPIVPATFDLEGLSAEVKSMISSAEISFSGEFLLSVKSKDRYYRDEVAYRNIPAGILNRKNVTKEECKRFSFVPYRINAINAKAEIATSLFDSLKDRLYIQKLLNKLFKTEVPYFLPAQENNTYSNILNSFQDYGFYYDGIVTNSGVKVSKERKEGNTYLYIIRYEELAYKTNNEYKDIKLSKIEWTLTRTGKLMPVANFDKVLLSGAYISRATLHNAKVVETNQIKEGMTLRIIRSGEVIPHVIGIVKNGELLPIVK